jgi:hypothetical protein
VKVTCLAPPSLQSTRNIIFVRLATGRTSFSHSTNALSSLHTRAMPTLERKMSDIAFAMFSRAGHYFAVTLRPYASLLSRKPPPPHSSLSVAAPSAADMLLTDTTPFGLWTRKGALAAAGSAQGGELRRSQERHPRQGCWGRVPCDGAGSQGSWAAPRRDRAQPSDRRLRIWAHARYSEIV